MRARGRSKRSVKQRVRDEVSEILRMWLVIERTYRRLTVDDRKRVEVEADPWGKSVDFDGFSANEEFEYFSAAVELIKDGGSYGGFHGREFDSHVPCLDAYRRMLDRFNRMSSNTPMGDLSVTDLIALLKEQCHPDYRER